MAAIFEIKKQCKLFIYAARVDEGCAVNILFETNIYSLRSK
jgi:hypothetical protein